MGPFEKGTGPERKAWVRIAMQGELVLAEQDHILVDSMVSQPWLVGELLGQVSWVWDTSRLLLKVLMELRREPRRFQSFSWGSLASTG